MTDREQYGDNLDALEIHLAAFAGVLGRFRGKLIDAGFSEGEAALFALEEWRQMLFDPDLGSE